MNKNKSSIPLFFWITLSLAFLIIAGSVAYYFLNYLPSKETAKSQVVQTQEVKQLSANEIRKNCETEGFDRAKSKLQSLIDSGLATGTQKAEYEKALKEGLALKEDIEYYRNLCLENNGLK